MWIATLRRTGAELFAGNCLAWSATLAYYFFLALFPALLFGVSLAGVLPAQPMIDRMIGALGHVAPHDVVEIARQQSSQIAAHPSVGLLVLSLLGAVWSVSSGITALADTLNQTYRVVEQRPWWRVRLTAIALTLILSTATAVAFTLVMFGPAWAAVQWLVAATLVAIAVGCLYHFAPDHTRRWAWLTPGSVTATAIWLLASIAFKAYVSRWADYQQTYGAIGGVLVALLWFYVSSLAILLGAQLDATIAQVARERDAAASPTPATPPPPRPARRASDDPPRSRGR